MNDDENTPSYPFGQSFDASATPSPKRVAEQLTEAHRILDMLTELIAEGAEAAADAAGRIADPAGLFEFTDPDCLDDHGRGLRPWLADLDSAAASATPGRSTVDVMYGLANWRMLAAQTEEKARALVAANTAPLAKREALRGRLDAFHQMAARLGLVEDEDCSPLYAQAWDVLFQAPTDLAVAEQLVTRYISCINMKRRREPGTTGTGENQ